MPDTVSELLKQAGAFAILLAGGLYSGLLRVGKDVDRQFAAKDVEIAYWKSDSEKWKQMALQSTTLAEVAVRKRGRE